MQSSYKLIDVSHQTRAWKNFSSINYATKIFLSVAKKKKRSYCYTTLIRKMPSLYSLIHGFKLQKKEKKEKRSDIHYIRISVT